MWIALIPAGLIVAAVSILLGRHLLGTFDPVMFSRSEGVPFHRRMTFDLISLVARVSVSFCFGSFLAALLYRKSRSASASLPGLKDHQG